MAAQFPGDALWDAAWVESDGERTIRRRSAESAPVITLYCSWFCPFAQRAWIALEESGAAYRYVEVAVYAVDETRPGGYTKARLPLEAKRAAAPAFVAASPRGLVPASDVGGGERLCESLPLCAYVDEALCDASRALLPRGAAHAYARAQCRRWIAEFDDRVRKPYYLMLMEQDPRASDAFREQMFDGARAFSRAMAVGGGGAFFLGGEFSLVEVACAPFWQRVLTVGRAYRGYALPDDPDFKRLEAWWYACVTRPSIAATLVCNDRLVAAYADYADNAATSDYAAANQHALSPASRLGIDAAVAAARPRVLRVALLLFSAFAVGFLAGRRRR